MRQTHFPDTVTLIQTANRLATPSRIVLFAIASICSACSLGTTRQIPVMADSPKLGTKNISLPTTVQMTELGRFNGVVDVSWISSNFEKIARKSLPREGGSGGDRYHFSKFSLTANPDGSLKGVVHVTLDNYKYTKKPWPLKGQWDFHAGHIESDVIAKITPAFDEGRATTVTSTKVIKTEESGFVKLWNDALPKIWFSLDRKFQTINNAAKKNDGTEVAVLKIQENADLDPFIDDILKRGLVQGKNIRFKQTDKGLMLVLDYQVVGGLPAYYEIYRSYKNNAYKTKNLTAQLPSVTNSLQEMPKPKP